MKEAMFSVGSNLRSKKNCFGILTNVCKLLLETFVRIGNKLRGGNGVDTIFTLVNKSNYKETSS